MQITQILTLWIFTSVIILLIWAMCISEIGNETPGKIFTGICAIAGLPVTIMMAFIFFGISVCVKKEDKFNN